MEIKRISQNSNELMVTAGFPSRGKHVCDTVKQIKRERVSMSVSTAAYTCGRPHCSCPVQLSHSCQFQLSLTTAEEGTISITLE